MSLHAFLAGQLRYMTAQGFCVSAVSSPGGDLDSFGLLENVDVHAVAMCRRIALFEDLAAVWQLVSYLRRHRPLILHAHTPKAGLLGLLAGALAGTSVRIYHVVGLPFMTATGARRALLKATETLACRLAHRVIVVSDSLRETVIDEGLCRPSKIRVIRRGSANGVDAARRFNPRYQSSHRAEARMRLGVPAGARVIGFVGRIVRDKGIVELANAWRTVRDACPDAHLLIVGPVEERDGVPETERSLRQDPRVHCAGMDWNTPPLYAAMDVLVLPTYREGLPAVTLEAAAMGLPVIATRIPGCVDAVQDGITGTLVPARDSAALAVAMRTYLQNPLLCHQHGQAGRQRMLVEFRPEAMWEGIYAEYCRLLADRGLPVPARTPPPPSPHAPSVSGHLRLVETAR
jgi:glycosyltransferase involved in cell wall biosynthesis